MPRTSRSEIRESVKEWCLEQGYDIATEGHPMYNYTALWVACENESYDILRQLVEDGVDIHSRDQYENTVLINVCRDTRFDEAKVKRLTESLVMLGANINATPSDYIPAFAYVCRFGYKSVAEYFIQQGVDINHTDRCEQTALSHACERKQRDIIELLLENNVSLDIQNGNADAFFIYACGAGMVDKVLMLLDRGIDCNLQGGEALYTACENGQRDIVKILLSRGFKTEWSQNKYYRIDNVFRNGHENIIGLLLEYSVILDIKYIFKLASLRGCIYILDLLLKQGVDINDNDIGVNVSTALMKACVGWRVETVKWLIEHGANVNLVSPKTGMNALMYSCSCMNGDIAKILIDNGININQTDKHMRTTLMHACKRGSYEIVKLLIENGVSINVQDKDGSTALMLASLYQSPRNWIIDNLSIKVEDESWYRNYSREQNIGKAKAIQLLIERGANIDMKDNRGVPAIFHVMKNHLNCKCLQLMIDAGANLEYFDEKGDVILPWVLENGRLCNVISILMNTGVFTENGRLKPKYKFVWNFGCGADIDCLKEMMNLGLFEWEMCRQKGEYLSNLPEVIPAAMESGICPGNIMGPDGVRVSPLIYSLKLEDRDLLKLIFNSGYFYPKDYTILCSDQSEELSDFVYDITHNPMSLFKWSFINVSKAISLGGSSDTRKQRVDTLDIPEKFKKNLKFFTADAM